MPPNSNYATDLIASTLEIYWSERPSDAVFGELALWRELASRARKSKQGGQKILVPIMYQKSTAVGSYDGYDVLDVTPQQPLTNAEFDWKFYYGTVSIDNPTQLKNRGPGAIINILKARIAQAEMSLADKLDADMFLDGTGNSSKDVVGLALMVDSAGTYGNISRTTYTWWGAQETAVSGVLAIGGSTGMRRSYNDCALGPTRRTPDFIITTQPIFEAYEAMMDPYMRFTNQSDVNAVFTRQNLMFRDAKMFWDDYCQTQTLYMLNSKHMSIVELDSREGSVDQGDDRDTGSFRLKPSQTPINQDAEVSQFFWAGNLVADNCKRLGKLTGVTNT